MKNPIKKMVLAYVTQRLLRRVAPKVIPGGLAAILTAEAIKYYLNHKDSASEKLKKTPKAKKFKSSSKKPNK